MHCDAEQFGTRLVNEELSVGIARIRPDIEQLRGCKRPELVRLTDLVQLSLSLCLQGIESPYSLPARFRTDNLVFTRTKRKSSGALFMCYTLIGGLGQRIIGLFLPLRDA